MDNTLKQLLQQIIENPEEDSIRLMYADRLDDLGENDRASFIRIQVELAKHPHYIKGLRERERVLMNCYWMEWVPAIKLEGLDKITLFSHPFENKLWNRPHPTFTRGFIDSITCTAEDFLKYADNLIWNSEMKEDCSKCKGVGKVKYRTYERDEWGPSEYDEVECTKCSNGKVPKPMPDTAQPITKVKLTTLNTGLSLGGNLLYQKEENAGKNIWHCDRFLGIEFELPANEQYTNELTCEEVDIGEGRQDGPYYHH